MISPLLPRLDLRPTTVGSSTLLRIQASHACPVLTVENCVLKCFLNDEITTARTRIPQRTMKRQLIALVTVLTSVAACGQGTVQFNNRLPALGIDARVLSGRGDLSDPAFKAQIYAGPEGTPIGSLKPVSGTTTFRTGIAAGYLNPIDLAIPGIAPGARATLVVRVYNGPTYESSAIFGSSNPITITLGGAGIPPGPGAPLIGLQSFIIAPAEPSTIALGILGAAILLLRWRRRPPRVCSH